MEDPVSTDLDLDLPLLTGIGDLSLLTGMGDLSLLTEIGNLSLSSDATLGGSCEERSLEERSLEEPHCRMFPSRAGGGLRSRRGRGGVLERCRDRR